MTAMPFYLDPMYWVTTFGAIVAFLVVLSLILMKGTK